MYLPLKELIEHPPLIRKDKSLNRPYRKQRLMNIMEQNKQLLGRLKDQKSEYSVDNCNKWRGDQQKLLKTICKYPYRPLTNSNTPVSTIEKQSPKSNRNLVDFEKYIQEQEKEHKELMKRRKNSSQTPQNRSRTHRKLTPTIKMANSPILDSYIADKVTPKNQGKIFNFLYIKRENIC